MLFEKPASRFFSKDEGAQIVEAIREAESETTGEIRVHLENHCPGMDAYARALKLFSRLKMDQTRERNSVLIYLAVRDHEFAILADEGMYSRVPEAYWEEIAARLQADFQNDQFVTGLEQAIRTIGSKLQQLFPGRSDDENQLPDEISYGE